MKITIQRRLPKAPKPKKIGRPIGTRKGAKGYDKKRERRIARRGEEE